MIYKGITFNLVTHLQSGDVYTNAPTENFDAYIWLAERFLVLIDCHNSSLTGDINVGMGTYTLDSEHMALIDCTDFARAFAPTDIDISLSSAATDQTTISISVEGLIDPNKVYVPEHPMKEVGLVIVPPSKMIWGDKTTQFPFTQFEMRWRIPIPALTYLEIYEFDDEGQLVYDTVFNEESAPHIKLYDASVQRISIADVDGTGLSYRIELMQPECEKTYVCVRWLSFTGVERTHVFEACKFKMTTADSYELLHPNDEYNITKGCVNGFTLKLEQLNRYDLWYYSDVIHSSRVQVSLDGANFYSVDVQAKEIVLPESDEGELTNLEIPINYRRYDAVSL